MMRFVGIALLSCVCAAIGLQKFVAYRRRLDIILEVERFLIYMKSELTYARNPMPEVFQKAADKHFPHLNGWIQAMAEGLSMSSRKTFAVIWRETAEIHMDKALKEDAVVQSFFHLGEEIGGRDLAGQIQNLELFLRELGQTLQALKEELPVKRKLYLSLGVMSGLFVAVLLI
jgi:stage III sporulation protein AB